jgi:predicted membrane-bound mannosyltransferase
METQINFDDWLASYQPAEVKYRVAYDPLTGAIFKVGNQTALVNDPCTVEIDTELAEKIIEGALPIHRCFVDLNTHLVEIAEIKSVSKINDVLHRVIELEHSLVDKHDVKLTYSRSSQQLTIELITKGHWTSDTPMPWYLTDYNDPTTVYKIINTVLADIQTAPAVFDNIVLPDRFSVYTKRLFRNYVLEIL